MLCIYIDFVYLDYFLIILSYLSEANLLITILFLFNYLRTLLKPYILTHYFLQFLSLSIILNTIHTVYYTW